MLGHKLVQELGRSMEVVAGLRARTPAFDVAVGDLPVVDFDAGDAASIEAALDEAGATVVVNAVGVIKQAPAATDPVTTITVNALYPHVLAERARRRGVRVIHVSTDCVFSGARGGYREDDLPDATDLYGRSKLLGELTAPGCLTLRTSMIGRELAGRLSLVEWFLGSRGTVRGFPRAIFSGLPTRELSRLIGRLITEYPTLSGLYQVAAEPIDKLTLLRLVRDAYGLSTEIVPDESVRIDRSLDGSRFRAATGYVAPDWPTMIADMHEDATPYDMIHAGEGERVGGAA
jgi:dTDP-4-dehydrorhamnose reductase